MALDITDDAAVLGALKTALIEILSGSKVQTIDIPSAGGGPSKRVSYMPSNITELRAEIARYESKVGATARKPKRRVIIAG